MQVISGQRDIVAVRPALRLSFVFADIGQDRLVQLNEWRAHKHLFKRPLLSVVNPAHSSTQLMKATAGRLLLSRQVSYLLLLGNLSAVALNCKLFCATPGVTVLVDPWLEGDLVFAKQTWLYRGQKGALKDVKLDIDAIGSKADVILLSQVEFCSLTPHTHWSKPCI